MFKRKENNWWEGLWSLAMLMGIVYISKWLGFLINSFAPFRAWMYEITCKTRFKWLTRTRHDHKTWQGPRVVLRINIHDRLYVTQYNGGAVKTNTWPVHISKYENVPHDVLLWLEIKLDQCNNNNNFPSLNRYSEREREGRGGEGGLWDTLSLIPYEKRTYSCLLLFGTCSQYCLMLCNEFLSLLSLNFNIYLLALKIFKRFRIRLRIYSVHVICTQKFAYPDDLLI